MLSSQEVADILNVPLLALGQLVFDGKLRPTLIGGDYVYYEHDVDAIKDNDLSEYR
jgi:hypothetical protein